MPAVKALLMDTKNWILDVMGLLYNHNRKYVFVSAAVGAVTSGFTEFIWHKSLGNLVNLRLILHLYTYIDAW